MRGQLVPGSSEGWRKALDITPGKERGPRRGHSKLFLRQCEFTNHKQLGISIITIIKISINLHWKKVKNFTLKLCPPEG